MADIETRVAALEAEIAVANALMPRMERKLDDHMTETKLSRQCTNDKLDALIATTNQAKGAALAFDLLRQGVVFLAGIGGLKWLGLIR